MNYWARVCTCTPIECTVVLVCVCVCERESERERDVLGTMKAPWLLYTVYRCTGVGTLAPVHILWGLDVTLRIQIGCTGVGTLAESILHRNSEILGDGPLSADCQ